MNSPEANGRILIIGIGNTLRGDDGVGPAVAQRLQQLLASDSVSVIPCHQLLPEMADDLSHAELAVFIDASCELPPGQVRCTPIQSVADAPQATTHDFDPPRLLSLSRQLFGRAPDAFIIAIGAESFEFEEKLSPAVAKVFGDVVQQVLDLVRRAAPHVHAGLHPEDAGNA